MAEIALPGFETGTWYGIVVPRNTPKAVVDKRDAEIQRVRTLPETREKLLFMGLEPSVSTPAALCEPIRPEIAKNAKIAQADNLKAD